MSASERKEIPVPASPTVVVCAEEKADRLTQLSPRRYSTTAYYILLHISLLIITCIMSVYIYIVGSVSTTAPQQPLTAVVAILT